ncbi:MAG: four helix bundle protein [Gemmatimonadota bacterium]|nr:four helix bundle protein [Gemmatimonadota bacterium]
MAYYKKLEAWQACHTLALKAYKATESFPSSERYGLTSQIRRAAYSAAANIVEGSSKRGDKDFRRFLDISLGSLAEIEYAFFLARELKFLTQESLSEIDQAIETAGKLTWGLYRTVSRDICGS